MRLVNRYLSVVSILITIFLPAISAAEVKYKVSDIPKSLLTDAKAVVRKNETVFEISDINKGVMKVTHAITILNTNGIDNSVFLEFYDKFLTVRKIHSTLFDRNGLEIRNGANTEIEDYSANAGYSLYEDNRVKFLDPKYRTTPFTVEYTYEIVFNGLFFYPDWKVYEDFNVSVENSSFIISTPKGFKFRYMENNIKDKCILSEENGRAIYTWNARNMPAIKNEPYCTPYEEFTPVVYMGPSDFEIDGFKGNLESWNNFGKWIGDLSKERNILNPATNEKIKKMVSGIDNDTDKIKILYNWLQSKVRYVSIQIGIGGWQTIEADVVDRLSYGDCKALSNYMKSLLDVVGIKSYYTLVMAGENAPPIKKDFPANQFNHAIICVPLNNDTIWLECTSQDIPFGYLGVFTDDRKVLLTSEEGGTIVNTKRYNIEDNRQIRIATIDLVTNGNATASVLTYYRGILYDEMDRVLRMDETDRKKFLLNRISIPSYNLISFSHTEERNIIPAINENLNLGLPGYGTIMGNRILINPNLMTRIAMLPYRTKERKSDISVRRSYCEIDTITIRLPDNYKTDQLPGKVSLTSKFGEYSSDISNDSNGIKYIRTFKFFKGNYPVDDYSEFVDFCEKVSAYDERKIAIIKNL